MTEPNPATVAERLAAAGVRVRPLVGELESNARCWRASSGIYSYSVWTNKNETGGDFVAWVGLKDLFTGTKSDCIAACDAHHAASVLAMLEVVASEEPQP